MEFEYSDRYIFMAEWFQEEAAMAREFYFYYYPADNTIEIYDLKTKRTFLRRTRVQHITSTHIYVGAKLNIFGRQITIKDYADSQTRDKLGKTRERAFGLIKPEAIPVMGKILSALIKECFSITNIIMVQLTQDQATKFYEHRKGESVLPFLIDRLTSGSIVAMEMVAKDAFQKFKTICGPEKPDEAKEQAPTSLRALFGQDAVKNAVHCAITHEQCLKELEFFFPANKKTNFQTTAILNKTSLGIIKPHAIAEGKLGDIIDTIHDCGFNVTAMKMFYMERGNCEEFYEVYKGIVPEYVQLVLELSNGPCVALEVSAKEQNIDTHSAFRKLCGPMDPELANQLRPQTIRAKFGNNKVQNGIHCTDLPEDAILEVEYFFKILE